MRKIHTDNLNTIFAHKIQFFRLPELSHNFSKIISDILCNIALDFAHFHHNENIPQYLHS